MDLPRRKNRRIALAATSIVIVGAFALTSCATTTASPTASESTSSESADTSEVETAIASDAEIWDASTVHDISVDVDEAAVADAVQEYVDTGEKVWVEASVTIDGVTFDQVGIRLKGNSSLRGISVDDDPATLPWIIRLDKYVEDRNLNGETDIVIRSNNSESSLNEAVALTLLDEAGLAAESASATRFSVNGGVAELRLAVQNPSDAWLEDEYGSDDGALYKAESGGDYSYRGDDPEAYTDIFDQEAGEDDLTPLIEFLAFINESDDATFADKLSERLDVDAFATYLAYQELINNFDDIDGPGNNSYLYYDAETGLMSVVTWDLNLAFGVQNGGGGGAGGGEAPGGGGPRDAAAGDGAQQVGGGAGRGGNVLSERFLEVDAFADLVAQAKAELQTTLIDSGVAKAVLDEWAALLESEASDLISAETVSEEDDAIRAYLE